MVFAKKAQSGIGTLIIFIAMIIVAAIAAGVLIQTAASLQNKALETGTDARGQVTTHIDVISVSATDALFHPYLNSFSEVFKLSSGSDPIRVDETLATLDTNDFTTNLVYSNATDSEDYFSYGLSQPPQSEDETGDIVNNNTEVYLRNDLNNDGIQEKIILTPNCDGLIVDFRNGTTTTLMFPSNINLSLCTSSAINCTFGDMILTNDSFVPGANIQITGTSEHNCEFDQYTDFRSSSDPTKVGTGYYTVNYMQKGSDWQVGYVQKGDVVEMKFASPENVGEEKQIRINIVPKVGVSTPIIFTTPEVMTMQRIYLFP